MVQREVLNAVYDDSTETITVLLGLKDVLEVNPPDDSFPGEPVGGQRWIRRITEEFNSEQLEVHTFVDIPFVPGATELVVTDASRFPNNGTAVINRGSATEEILTYTGKSIDNTRLIGTSSPTYTHSAGELVFPSVEIDFLGAYEVDLRPFGLGGQVGPVRHHRSTVILNDVTELHENVDYVVVNDFSGTTCTRTRLRFESGGQPRRFEPGDFLQVQYEFFVQQVGSIEIHTRPGQTGLIDVIVPGTLSVAFISIESANREPLGSGSIRVTPPFSATTLPPEPVKVVVPDVTLPSEVVTTTDVNVGDSTISVSDVQSFPTPGTLIDATDDAENRTIVLNGDTIMYSDVDVVNNQLVGVVGITSSHPSGSEVTFDGARYVRDIVKNAINSSKLRGQLEALSVDAGGRHLRIRTKGSTGTFNLQPGTYRLSYIGFNDDIDRGLHTDVTTSVPFENKDLTFNIYQRILNREDVAKTYLGQTASRRTQFVATNPTDETFGVP